MPWYIEVACFAVAGAIGGIGVWAGIALYELILKALGAI